MSLLKYINRLKRMDELIRRKATGTPDEFAEKLSICKSMLMRNLNELKEMGAPIKYDQQRHSYFYEGQCTLIFEFKNLQEGSQLKGGENIFHSMSHSNNSRIAFSTFDEPGR